MEEKRPVFKGEIYIDGGKIFRIKEAKTEKSERTEKPALNEEEKWDEEIDAEGNLIMPGFKNAHTHSAMTFLRSYADDMKLQEWLFDKVFPAEAKLTSDDVYHLTKLAILEYLTSGITAAFDMYKLKQDSAKAAEELGFRMVFCGDINDFGGTLEEMEQDYFRYQCEETPLLSYQFGFHAEYTTSRNLMEGIAQLAGKYKKPVYVHCSETKREVEECREKTGMTPIAYMDSLGLFENGGGLFHGVHLDEADFDIMKTIRKSPKNVMNSEMSASRHSVTNIIIRQPTNCAAALIIVGRLFVRPCCKVDTSFVIRLSISPCECELKYF